MPATGQDRLIARLRAIADLGPAEIDMLAALPMTTREAPAGRDLVREGDRVQASCILIEGFLQRHKDLPNGARQILAFHIAGDVPDLQSLHLPVMDHTISAVTDSTVAVLPHSAVEALMRAHPALERAFWRESLIDAAKFRTWIANLGGRSAFPRLAHLLCELYVRSRAVGLGEAGTCLMPLTQARLGEALGLSVVHVNRTMAALRRDGLLELKGGRLRILDWPRLTKAAGFEPGYLHLRRDPVAEDVGWDRSRDEDRSSAPASA